MPPKKKDGSIDRRFGPKPNENRGRPPQAQSERQSLVPAQVPVQVPAPRPRGRPRKHPRPEPEPSPEGPKRPRGRPKRVPELDHIDLTLEEHGEQSEDGTPEPRMRDGDVVDVVEQEHAEPRSRSDVADVVEQEHAEPRSWSDVVSIFEEEYEEPHSQSHVAQSRRRDEDLPAPPNGHFVDEIDFEKTQYTGMEIQSGPLDQRAATLLSQKAGSTAWHCLWRLILHKFGKTPYDLFTWGLQEPNNLDVPLLQALCSLIPHPFWKSNMGRLRYALQKAITYRVHGHVEPLGPLSEGLADMVLRISEPGRPEFALGIWNKTKMETEDLGGQFIEFLKQHVQKEPVIQQSQDDYNDVFFYLQVRDVFAIQSVLDQMSTKRPTSFDLFYFTVDEHHRRFREAVQSRWDLMAPYNQGTFERWDLWETKERLRSRENLEADFPRDERDTYTSIAYWSVFCDNRFEKSIFPHLLDDSDLYNWSLQHATTDIRH